METIVIGYVEEIPLSDGDKNVTQTFISLSDEITYTGYKVSRFCYGNNVIKIAVIMSRDDSQTCKQQDCHIL